MNLTIFKSVTRAWIDAPDQQIDEPWETLVAMFSEHQNIQNKEDGLMFNLVKFKSIGDPTAELGRTKEYINKEWTGEYIYKRNTVRRCKANVIGIDGIVLDVDNTLSIGEIIDELQDLEFFLYTTFNHTAQQHKFRVIIPFSRMLLKEDIAGREADIMSVFPGVDQSSFSVSQSFYFHSGLNDPIVYHNRGEILDPYIFKYTAPPVSAPVTFAPTTMDDNLAERYRHAVIESLLSCSNVRYRGDKQGGILTLVSICRSVGLEFEEFDSIAQRIGAADSTMQQADKRLSAWQDWQGDRIGRGKRDQFISDYGGQPIRVAIPKLDREHRELDILAETLRKKFLSKE